MIWYEKHWRGCYWFSLGLSFAAVLGSLWNVWFGICRGQAWRVVLFGALTGLVVWSAARMVKSRRELEELKRRMREKYGWEDGDV